jgi:hypothetical protein
MELDYALQIDIDEVIARDYEKVVFDIEIAHAVTQGIGIAFIVIERLVAEILVIGDSQAFEEALTGFKIVAQVECIAGTLAAQDEPATALTGQDPEKIGNDSRVT